MSGERTICSYLKNSATLGTMIRQDAISDQPTTTSLPALVFSAHVGDARKSAAFARVPWVIHMLRHAETTSAVSYLSHMGQTLRNTADLRPQLGVVLWRT